MQTTGVAPARAAAWASLQAASTAAVIDACRVHLPLLQPVTARALQYDGLKLMGLSDCPGSEAPNCNSAQRCLYLLTDRPASHRSQESYWCSIQAVQAACR